ncbi:MAG TPA: DnaJ family domain-containing protein [Lacipirellulaceae bacterium]|nr:DnaJ family domain-containing protein [Lacipirellulaceae bacterium]
MSAERISFSDRAIQIIAENKIRAAVEAGEFDNLPAFGQPSAIIDEPYDPHWWIPRQLQREEIAAILDSRRT